VVAVRGSDYRGGQGDQRWVAIKWCSEAVMTVGGAGGGGAVGEQHA
jgi:hypothetical protein